MIGSVILWCALAAAVGSTAAYARSAKRKGNEATARWLFAGAGAAVLVAAALLMTYILQHRFEYGYIWSYSSRDLPLSLLITTFWAGQEGSFVLWSVFAVVIGGFLLRYARRNRIEAEVMAVYGAIVSFLLVLLCAKSPFTYVWDVAATGVPQGAVPPDGRGLNPLLQNFWMIIHPPVLFLGFAALAVPFTLAVAALWKKNFSDWIRQALPWTLFGAATLGAGLMLGGYWAYGVLGWGGWWGWDPVENSSLIPWIVSIILLHSMLIQLLTGRLVRTNFALAVSVFLLVVYSTFLTRSGILAESSVHSFVDPGMFAYTLLVLWLVGCAAVGYGLLWLRRKELRSAVPTSPWFTRETALAIAAVVMGTSAVIILFGTSWPLLSKVLPFGQASVDASFYDRTNLPLAALMVVLLGISLKVKWNEDSQSGILQRLALPTGVTVLALAGLIWYGMRDAGSIALAAAALFAFVASLEHGYRLLKQSPALIGGALSHAGLAILLLGIIASGTYGRKESASLPQGQPKQVLGYTLVFTGGEQRSDGKWQFNVTAERNGVTERVSPVMFESAYNNSVMRNPDYISFLTRDFYLEPVSLEEGTPENPQVELSKGQAMMIGPLEVTFVRFEMGGHGSGGMMGGSPIAIGAVLDVKTPKGKQTVIPTTTFGPSGPTEMKSAMVSGSPIGFQLAAMNIDPTTRQSMIRLNIIGTHGMGGPAASPPVLVVEASVKPFMTFVWAAAVLIIGGLATAMVRRIRINNA